MKEFITFCLALAVLLIWLYPKERIANISKTNIPGAHTYPFSVYVVPWDVGGDNKVEITHFIRYELEGVSFDVFKFNDLPMINSCQLSRYTFDSKELAIEFAKTIKTPNDALSWEKEELRKYNAKKAHYEAIKSKIEKKVPLKVEEIRVL